MAGGERPDQSSDKALPERETESKRYGQEKPADAPSIPTVSTPADPPQEVSAPAAPPHEASQSEEQGPQDEG